MEIIINYYVYEEAEIIEHPLLKDKAFIRSILFKGEDVTTFILYYDFLFYKELEKIVREHYLTNKTALV